MTPWERTPAAGGIPLFWRVLAMNAVLLAAATAMLALTPATVSDPVAATELAVLAVGIAMMLVVNLALLRRAFAPLERLTRVAQRVDPLAPGERVPVEALDSQVATLARSFNEMLDRLETERRDSARRALAAQEGERVRIARELHDEVGQGLTAVLLGLERAVRAADGEERAQLEEVREAVRTMVADIRDIARRLRPEALDDLGLTSALTALISDFAKQARVRVHRRLNAELASLLGAEEELVVYRVAQEALTNVARHAEARSVDVLLERRGDAAVLLVCDDGRGLAGPMDDATRGIRGMRERAVLVGGTLAIGPADGGGTFVRLDLPVPGAQR